MIPPSLSRSAHLTRTRWATLSACALLGCGTDVDEGAVAPDLGTVDAVERDVAVEDATSDALDAIEDNSGADESEVWRGPDTSTLPAIEPHCDREWVLDTSAAYVELVESECEVIPSLVLAWWDDGSDPLPLDIGPPALRRVTVAVRSGPVDVPLPNLTHIDGVFGCDPCRATRGAFPYPLQHVGRFFAVGREVGSMGPLAESLTWVDSFSISFNAPHCEYARLNERLARTSPHAANFGPNAGTDPGLYFCGTWDTDCDGEPEVPERICDSDERCAPRVGGGFDCQPLDDRP